MRDVFAVPTACLLVRADLFRTIGGFDPSIEYRGDDIDLCWRAHLSGARVVVVPAARARHREQLAERCPDLRLVAPAARSRMRSVATLTGARRLPWVLLQLVVVTIAPVVVPRRSAAGSARPRRRSRAMVGMVPRTPAYIARRRVVAPLRHVPDTEVAGLQVRGSARMTAYMRARDSRPVDPELGNERRWRESAGSAPALAWLAVLLLFLVGSRKHHQRWRAAVRRVPALQAQPSDDARRLRLGLVRRTVSAAPAAVPTAIGLTALGSVVTLFHMGMLHTVRGARSAARRLSRRVASGHHLPDGAGPHHAAGGLRRGAAAVSAARRPVGGPRSSATRPAPWVVHLLRRLAGLDTRWIDSEPELETVRDVPTSQGQSASSPSWCSSAPWRFAFAPAYAVMLVGMGLVLALATLVCGGSWRSSAHPGRRHPSSPCSWPSC